MITAKLSLYISYSTLTLFFFKGDPFSVRKRFGMIDSKSVEYPIVPRSKLCGDENGVKVKEIHYKKWWETRKH